MEINRDVSKEGRVTPRKVDRRALLRGIAAGGPAIVTLYGGRAWAVSSCGQVLRNEMTIDNSTQVKDVNDVLLPNSHQALQFDDEQLVADIDLEETGLGASCLVSFNG